MIDHDKPQYLTSEGRQQLQERLEHLRTVRRDEVMARIRELNGIGGLVESSEFEDAMTEQAQLEKTIRDIEYTLRHAQNLSNGTNGNGHQEVVQVGMRVCVRDGEGYESCWTIVGPAEANTRNGKISNESPIGAAVIGKRVGEHVSVSAPAGVIEYTILKIE
jgi:transcription elongation factor GreA